MFGYIMNRHGLDMFLGIEQ